MMNSERISILTGEEEFRKYLKEDGDPFGIFAEKMEHMSEFISAVCEGIHSKELEIPIFKDITSSGIMDLKLVAWFLRIIDHEPLTGRVIFRIKERIDSAMEKYSGELLSSKANILELTTEYDVTDEIYLIPVEEFTRLCTRITGSRYRLTFQTLRDSMVLTEEEILKRVIKEAIGAFIRDRVDIIEKEKALELFSGYESMMETLSKKALNIKIEAEMGPIDTEAFPPCIRHYISDIQNGINLPHMGRFAMVSFLNKVGMKQEDIMAIFGTVPDFNARITEYQVRHIMGSISGIKYSPPKCETLRSNHLCYMGDDPVCAMEKVNHPLQYYLEKKKRAKKA